MKSPVLFIIFKREDTTRRVFERIREAQPPRLYIAADGPRKDRPEEVEKCKATRDLVENIDWPCEVHRLYREENLGCGMGVSSAISWFFDNEEEGIIIEDDVLAHPDFFKYCDEMLKRYRNNEEIHLISGRNSFFDKTPKHHSSYFFSNYMMIWGWASWRRVWRTYHYDLSIISRSEFINKLKKTKFQARPFIWNLYKTMLNHECDTWDHQFFVNQIMNERVSIIPYVNMVENLGIASPDATHSSNDSKRIEHKAYTPYPLVHPDDVIVDDDSDYIHAINEGIIGSNWYIRTKGQIKMYLDYLIF